MNKKNWLVYTTMTWVFAIPVLFIARGYGLPWWMSIGIGWIVGRRTPYLLDYIYVHGKTVRAANISDEYGKLRWVCSSADLVFLTEDKSPERGTEGVVKANPFTGRRYVVLADGRKLRCLQEVNFTIAVDVS